VPPLTPPKEGNEEICKKLQNTTGSNSSPWGGWEELGRFAD